jgi:hypothetical protein
MHGVKHGYGAVENAQGALHFSSKVHVAWGIDNIDANIAPGASGSGGRNGNAALLLLFHPVHGGGAFMHFANAVRDARIEQDTFSRSCFAGINVGHDPDVAATF